MTGNLISHSPDRIASSNTPGDLIRYHGDIASKHGNARRRISCPGKIQQFLLKYCKNKCKKPIICGIHATLDDSPLNLFSRVSIVELPGPAGQQAIGHVGVAPLAVHPRSLVAHLYQVLFKTLCIVRRACSEGDVPSSRQPSRCNERTIQRQVCCCELCLA